MSQTNRSQRWKRLLGHIKCSFQPSARLFLDIFDDGFFPLLKVPSHEAFSPKGSFSRYFTQEERLSLRAIINSPEFKSLQDLTTLIGLLTACKVKHLHKALQEGGLTDLSIKFFSLFHLNLDFWCAVLSPFPCLL